MDDALLLGFETRGDAVRVEVTGEKHGLEETMQAFHTAGLPPSSGRIIFPTIGWTMNNSDALTNSVTANSSGTGNSGCESRDENSDRRCTFGRFGRRAAN